MSDNTRRGFRLPFSRSNHPPFLDTVHPGPIDISSKSLQHPLLLICPPSHRYILCGQIPSFCDSKKLSSSPWPHPVPYTPRIYNIYFRKTKRSRWSSSLGRRLSTSQSMDVPTHQRNAQSFSHPQRHPHCHRSMVPPTFGTHLPNCWHRSNSCIPYAQHLLQRQWLRDVRTHPQQRVSAPVHSKLGPRRSPKPPHTTSGMFPINTTVMTSP